MKNYRLTAEEAAFLASYREQHKGLAEECGRMGIPLADVTNYWYKGKHYSIQSRPTIHHLFLEKLEELAASLKVPRKKIPRSKTEVNEKAIKATISDCHVGLEPDPKGRGLYPYQYNADIFRRNLEDVYNSLLDAHAVHGRFDLCLLDDLGDGMDGWNEETVRGGHRLSQNMGNVEQFKTYVTEKYNLICQVVDADIAEEVLVRNVVNCNHAGTFGHIANAAIQMLLDKTYGEGAVKFYMLERFMEHFYYGDHCFILTHGKDEAHCKGGLPYRLDDRTKNFINGYIDEWKIKSKYIHLEKGDLHQVGYQRTKRFDYRNYMSFAPPSPHGQHNFDNAYSGYSIQIVPKYSDRIQHMDVYFEQVKKGTKRNG